jgi:serine/threonine protein kinase
LDLLNKLLVYSPSKRLTAIQALAHPYFEELHDEKDELEAEEVLNFSFETESVDTKSIKSNIFIILEMLYQEILEFNKNFENDNEIIEYYEEIDDEENKEIIDEKEDNIIESNEDNKEIIDEKEDNIIEDY